MPCKTDRVANHECDELKSDLDTMVYGACGADDAYDDALADDSGESCDAVV